jgi:hypothetical protein
MMVFPEPAKAFETISSRKELEGEPRTKAVYPQQRSVRFPLRECVTLREPRGSVTVMGFSSNIMV